MSKRTIIAVATGVIAGATVVGVPAFAYADAASETGTADSHMESVMEDPAFYDRMMAAMSDMMSDPQMQEQMRDHMRTMMEGMSSMEDMEDMHGHMDGMGGGMGGESSDDAGDSATP
ncbi:hypothetical protein [Blastococcus sp. KM273129]|uniref:hypothetical protein n=1 Tax=Blastococcus sp. KM273129 TaxID=2570315 RepID=UPI001F38B3D9|nr:hypothetical protein [Blastococcus sp. KM273129]MCF6735865.1 hypothetical protein [Blastococcus sp. KM273129]